MAMEIEFDPAKDEANIAKHGVSLRAAEGLAWEATFEREDDRFPYGEMRFIALGPIGDRLYSLAFTEGSHENVVRAISLRLAEKHEVRFYYAHI
jgi:uncharacterized DUF497 family protein